MARESPVENASHFLGRGPGLSDGEGASFDAKGFRLGTYSAVSIGID